MTKQGETDDFNAEDFISEIEKYLGKGVLNYALFNNKKPLPGIVRRYKKEGARPVDLSTLNRKSKKPKYIVGDFLDSGKFVRHSSKKLAEAILGLI
jgi:2-phospho-L-lactate transferase/gluconeogenesis factor (CofD/UPF0052 family)